MGLITLLTEYFLLGLALGVGFFSFLADIKEMGAGFLRLVYSLCMGALAGALALHFTYASLTGPQTICYLIAGIAFLAVYSFQKERRTYLGWVLYGAHNIALFYLLFLFQKESFSEFLFSLSSILLLGGITYLMVMGHWYLVTPKLSERPLLKGMLIVWLLLIVKICWSSYSAYENASYFTVGTRDAGGYAFNWLLLIMRTLWGYGVIGGMSYFTWRLIKMRSIQSATGILYAMTFFIFIGELISNYMHFKFGLFI